MDMLPRHAADHGRAILDAFPALAISGARQVGKSTLAQHLAAGRPHHAVTLDDPSTFDAARADQRAFVEQAGDGLLVIDEVQRLPELALAIKASIDRDRRPGRFLLTGSADLLNVKGRSDSLAGRAVTLRLRGFSQGELLGVRDAFIDAVLARTPPPRSTTWDRAAYVAALGRGGYPDVQDLPPRMRHAWIDSYVDRVLQRDAVALPSGGQTSRIRTLLGSIAADQAGELVKARLADQTNVPANSVSAYLDVLHSVFLVDSIPPWTTNLTKREVGRPKTLVSDSAVALRLTRQTPRQLEALTSDTIGGHLEAFVASKLLKQMAWSSEEFQLFHYRDRNGAEVDLVVELDDGRVIGIEVKASSTFRTQHFKGLRMLQEKLGDRFIAGFVLGTATEPHQHAERLMGLPISALWEWRP